MPSKKSKEATSNEEFPNLPVSSSNANTLGKWGTKKAWGASGKVVFVKGPEATSSSSTTVDDLVEVLTPPETTRVADSEIVATAATAGSGSPAPPEVFPEDFSQPLSTDATSHDDPVSPYVGLRLLSSSSKNESPTPWNFSATPFVPSVSSSSSSSLPTDSTILKTESPESSTEDIQQSPSLLVSSEPPPPSPQPPTSSTSLNSEEILSKSVPIDPFPALPSAPAPAPSNIFSNDDFPSLGALVVPVKPVVWSAESSRNVKAPALVVSLFESTKWNEVEVEAPRERGRKPMAPLIKTPHNTFLVFTNSYVVNFVNMEIFQYDVIIWKCYTPQGKTPRRAKINGTKGSDRTRQTQCVRILDAVLPKFCPINAFIYDGAIHMYLPKAIEARNIRENVIVESTDKVWPDDIKRDWFEQTGGRFEIEIKQKETLWTEEIMTELFTNKGSDSTKVRTMLQIGFTTEPRRGGFLVSENNDIFLPVVSEEVYDDQKKPKLEKSGISLGVNIAEGEDQKGRVQLTIAHTLTNFFPVTRIVNLQPLLKANFTNLDDCRKILKNLRVCPIYSTRLFEIQGFSDCPVSQLSKITKVDPVTNHRSMTTMLEDGKKLAKGRGVTQYNSNNYAVKYEIPNTDRTQGRIKHFHLLENLKILPDQKMPAAIADGPPPPDVSVRVAESKNVAEAAMILTPNPTLDAFQISIDPNPIQVHAVRIEPPEIHYGGDLKHKDISKGSWRPGSKLVRPVSIKSVLILFHQESRQAFQKIEQFRHDLAENSYMLAERIPLNAIKIEDLTQQKGSPEDVLERRIADLKRKNENPYVFYADGIRNSHGYVKLIERQSGILIQHLDIEESIRRSNNNIAKSIILKMNMRIRGMNHLVKVKDPSIKDLWGPDSNTLIISYDVCYCAGERQLKLGEPTTEPSTIGFGFNGTANSEVFIGDFHYQNPRQEIVNGPILQSKTIWMMDKYTRARGKTPRNIVIMRDGVSDAQYDLAKDELDQIVTGVQKYMTVVSRKDCKRNIKITVPSDKINFSMLVITKRHSHRFHDIDSKGNICNVPPMTAICDVIVRKEGSPKEEKSQKEGEQPEKQKQNRRYTPREMFFVPHKPQDGTSSPHLITVLYNEVFSSFDQLMKLMAGLCCANQTSTYIGSLPDCLKAADAYAKRGADLFEAYSKQLKRQVKELPTKPYINGLPDTDWDKVSVELCYESSPKFQNLRLA